MRTTTQALLCSFAIAACAPIGEHGVGDTQPDAGAGSATAACDQMEQRTQDLTVTGTTGFINLPTGCWQLIGRLTVTSTAVTSVAKLGDLRKVTNLVLDDTDLTKLDTKSAVEVTGEITIRYNDKLTDLANIAPMATIQTLVVENNLALTSLGGLSKTVLVTGQTRIINNAKLATLDLGTATRFEGGLAIQDNPLLATIDLHTLESVADLAVRHNAVLTGINTGIKYIHGTLAIEDNAALRTLGTFGSAAIVDLGLVVARNTQLADLGKLDHATQIFGPVSITGNTALTTTKAHDVGCCVPTGGYSASNTSGTCQGNHWCQSNHNCYRGI